MEFGAPPMPRDITGLFGLPTPPCDNGVDGTTNFPKIDPSSIEFVPLDTTRTDEELFEGIYDTTYPFVNMLRGSARYIADHRGETCVFHIPGEMLDTPGIDKLMDDIALSWLLGLKIVIVVGCRYDVECCSVGCEVGMSAHECQNTLRVTDDTLLRAIEEEAGYVRFEVERRLNRSLRLHGGMSKTDDHSPLPSGNVIGGNFYTAKPFGMVQGKDYQNTGYPANIHDDKIKATLARNDIVLLTSVGSSRLGSCVNVNGNHLAAFVASALGAHKLVYFSSKSSVLRKQGEEKTLQDIPLSIVKSFLDFHKVKVHRAGFASFTEARKTLQPSAVQMLLHMGWASWALEHGVKRAHIVNPGDGTLLEELYTAKHGANTCLYKDDEHDDDDDDDILDSMLSNASGDEILFSELQ
jgi:amino-acid N-acetyltransferase